MGSAARMGSPAGMGLSSVLAVSTILAILRGGCGRRHRRDDRHRAFPGADRGAALLLHAAVLLRATLTRPAWRRLGESVHTSEGRIGGNLDSEPQAAKRVAPVRTSMSS